MKRTNNNANHHSQTIREPIQASARTCSEISSFLTYLTNATGDSRTLLYTRIGQMNLLTSQGDGIDEFALAPRALNHVSVNRWQ